MGYQIVSMMFALLAGAGIVVLITMLLRKKGNSAPMQVETVTMVCDRVRAVGKLVGLEVSAKEIATSTKGWSWVPPLLLSQAKLAMIFHFEKQYFVDLGKLRASDIEELGPDEDSKGRYRVKLPALEGTLRLSNVTPYDIQAGRVMGLLDVIQMNAQTQEKLMRSAQDQAGQLFKEQEPRYHAEAERAITRQLETLLGMFDAEVEVLWGGEAKSAKDQPELEFAVAE